MVVVPDAGLRPGVDEREVGIDDRERRQLPRLAVGEELLVRVRDRVVLPVPEQQEADVAAVVAAGDLRGREPVPDRRQVDTVERVVQPVGDAAVEVEAIGEGRPQDRREIAVAGCERGRCAAEERQILLPVVADRIEVAAGLAQPAVARAVVPLDAGPVVGVVGIRVRAALVVGRQRVRRVGCARRVDVRESRLFPVGAGQPAHDVVERPVLHHHDDDVVDPRGAGLGQARRRGGARHGAERACAGE